MVGSVAVGVVLVSGTDGDLEFTEAERDTVVQQVIQGLGFLSRAAPLGNLTFVYDFHLITVDAAPLAGCNSYESCEAVWRDPALRQLGYQAGYSGCVNYVEALRDNRKTDWSYVAFFTKYPQFHFAYAGGVRLCMQYSNDNWGPDQIDRVFAHETCHIFGAADEYGECGCGPSGEFKVPNSNCKNCTGSQVPCLMDGNIFTLCYWSRGQIGWWPTLVEAGVGATTVDGGKPLAFTIDKDRKLWIKAWTGDQWYWTDLGGGCAGGVGATTVDGRRPFAFVIGNDRKLWVNSWTNGAWGWTNLGGGCASGVGVTTVDGGRPYAYVIGDDRKLWLNSWNNNAWGWTDLGGGCASGVGVTTVDGGRPYAYVISDDRKLWLNSWNNNAYGWTDLGGGGGGGCASGVGVTTVDGGRPYAYVIGKDRKLWLNSWNNNAYGWTDLGGGCASGVGVTTVDGGRPFAFVIGADGKLWLNSWTNNAWLWENLGTPDDGKSKSAIVRGVGATTVDGGRPFAYVIGADGALWTMSWTDNRWQWAKY
jgi:hypothetical protein